MKINIVDLFRFLVFNSSITATWVINDFIFHWRIDESVVAVFYWTSESVELQIFFVNEIDRLNVDYLLNFWNILYKNRLIAWFKRTNLMYDNF